MAGARRRVHEILEIAEPDDTVSKVFDWSLAALIALNVAAVVLETVPSVAERWGEGLRVFELVSVAVFTVEYVLRLWTAPEAPGFGGPLGRVRLALRPMLLVDLVAILPAYLGFVAGVDLRFLRVLRLLRMFKLTRHSAALRLFGRVLQDRRSELTLAFFVLGVALVLTSSAMYLLEHDAQPEVFPSIPAAMWWGSVTLATVGYGDVVPVTMAGKALGGVLILLGIAVYALPVAVITSGFTDELARRRRPPTCPHCGKGL